MSRDGWRYRRIRALSEIKDILKLALTPTKANDLIRCFVN